MKKFILLFLLSIATMSGIRAQLPDGAIAPDWTMTDLDGNVHHLQDYLDEGKTVFIDMFATWCGPCWNYHQTHALANLYDQYGPNGTNQVMVFGIESDLATPTNCIYDIDCPSSQGDWTIGVPYPMIDCTPTNGGNFPEQLSAKLLPNHLWHLPQWSNMGSRAATIKWIGLFYRYLSTASTTGSELYQN
jgi:thiol-disulfide isomerase/thioredoxin